MSAAEQAAWRDRFRRHWQQGVAFNVACGMTVRRWDADGVEMHLRSETTWRPPRGVPRRRAVGADRHGGLRRGRGRPRLRQRQPHHHRGAGGPVPVRWIPGQTRDAFARCTRRGRQINYAEVIVRSDAGKELAHGLVTVSVSGTRELEARSGSGHRRRACACRIGHWATAIDTRNMGSRAHGMAAPGLVWWLHRDRRRRLATPGRAVSRLVNEAFVSPPSSTATRRR